MTNTNERPAEEGMKVVIKDVTSFAHEWYEAEKKKLFARMTDTERDIYENELSRTRKEAEEKAWRAAVEAVPLQKLSPYSHRKRGMNKARQQLIQAAKDSGVNLEV